MEEEGWDQGTLVDRLHSRDMEIGVDPHGPREREPYCCQGDDPQDGKRTHKPGHQLPGFHVKRQVPCGEPRLLAKLGQRSDNDWPV